LAVGYINKILNFSAVDGPGNRTVIFFQGCNFNCLYCHNPETINFCSNCGKCYPACNSAALTFENSKINYIEKNCTNCDNCTNICELFSSPKVKKTTVDEIFKSIEKTRPFISGITFSGGECTYQYNFLKSLLEESKKRNISAFIDTNAYLDFEKMVEISKLFDKSMVDIKWFDDVIHKKLTGKSNELVLKNTKYLFSQKKVYEIRTVVFPHFHENELNIKKIAKFISENDKSVIYKIIGYRSFGVKNSEKYTEFDEKELTKYKFIAENEGCQNVIVK